MASVRTLRVPVAIALACSCVALAPVASRDAQAAKQPGYVNALLTLKHERGIEAFARSVSNPRSARYRRYASVEALVKRFGATTKAKRSVERWLAENGVEGSVARTGTFAVAELPAERAEELLAAPDAAAAGRAGGSAPAAVPFELEPHVQSVEILSDAPVAEPATAIASADQVASASKGPHTSILPHTGTAKGCPEGTTTHLGSLTGDSAFTPNQYLKAYGHKRLHKAGARGQGARVAVVEIDGFLRSDVETFGDCFGVRVPPTPVFEVGIPAPLPPGPETTLDLEILSAAAPGLRSIDVYQGGAASTDILKTSAAALGPKGRHPEAISMSLVICELFLKLKGGKRVVRSANEVYALAAGAGISVFAAAGDHGSTGCDLGEILPTLATSFPASSPWVTAVGGTNFRLSPQNRIVKERVWNDSPILPRAAVEAKAASEPCPSTRAGSATGSCPSAGWSPTSRDWPTSSRATRSTAPPPGRRPAIPADGCRSGAPASRPRSTRVASSWRTSWPAGRDSRRSGSSTRCCTTWAGARATATASSTTWSRATTT